MSTWSWVCLARSVPPSTWRRAVARRTAPTPRPASLRPPCPSMLAARAYSVLTYSDEEAFVRQFLAEAMKEEK